MGSQRHFFHVFSTFAAAGPQVRTADILNSLGSEVRHTIVAMDQNFECRDRIHAEVAVNCQAPPVANALRMPGKLAAMMRADKPDLVLTYNWGATESIVASRLSGVRAHIHGEDGFGPDEVPQRKRRRNWARRILLRMVSRVVVPSRLLQRIARREWKCREPRLVYIPNGIDTDHFSPGDRVQARRAWGWTGGRKSHWDGGQAEGREGARSAAGGFRANAVLTGGSFAHRR